MGRVFMSFLGTTGYVPVHYQLRGKTSGLTPFVQEALVELLCSDWEEEDRLIFFPYRRGPEEKLGRRRQF
ncbi:hypothetical protein FVE67_08535 [Thermosulfurimonas marina]|uniref:Uncharacterized protein n=1 Tax=Thermosulfurimonas marina TaxID=2047767 RepID=A0A6H1WUF6_9BACT|nr:TM1812 family CRISPR-associated protein [Thermosulfurimonas marina]QJA06832.1 hypothetical protein FVE67_08535 [Thermosulfurimonas marina]